MKHSFYILFLVGVSVTAQENTVTISGKISSEGQPVPFASVYLKDGKIGTDADLDGNYILKVAPESLTLMAQAQGYKKQSKQLTLQGKKEETVDFSLAEDAFQMDQIVVSATRNRISKKEAPVIVNVLSPKLFKATQSISLADGLSYQPGVRIETNCQNCGFTQVRLNGLEGQYTQILLNSRPVFSALNGVYGLEQIPVGIIDRVEVVRSGGSALFGSNAIAGTVNVITKEPINNSWEVNSNFSQVGS